MEPWKELLVYWRSRHVDGRPPGRHDIDPAVDLPKLVANLLIADVVPEGYRYRLVGSAIVERHKEEMTGKLAGTSKFLARVNKELIATYDSVRDEQKPKLLVSGTSKDDHAGAVTIILPLLGKGGETAKLLVGVFYDRRFDPIDQVDYRRVNQPPD